ncbi:MAG: MBL fold metallo-hydrolase [Myxococcota bacterium]
MNVTLLGATDTVTGSRVVVRTDRAQVLVDCGLFQGLKVHRLRNWDRFPVDPASLDAVVLTHAHVDHTGYLPALVRDGFAGRVWCTSGTAALSAILLPDAGFLQEEEAKYRNRTGTTRHHPALPLYTADDGRAVLPHLAPVGFGAPIEVAPGMTATFTPAGHVLGAASVHLDDGRRTVLVSGDLGRSTDLLMKPPQVPPGADLVVIESTYGDRTHPAVDLGAELAAVVIDTVARGGTLLIPAFAVGRAQLVLHLLATLTDAGAIPAVPVWVDSPMATDATRIFVEHAGEHRLSPEACARMCAGVRFVRTVDESKALDAGGGPRIVISASGMATGGRVVHHLKAMVGDPRNTVCLTGFQAAGTRGETLAGGATAIKIHGVYWPVAAKVVQLRGSSSHADQGGLLDWLGALPRRPDRVAVVHGEPLAQDTLRRRITDRFGYDVTVPRLLEPIEVG